jgi:hypothetical protein
MLQSVLGFHWLSHTYRMALLYLFDKRADWVQNDPTHILLPALSDINDADSNILIQRSNGIRDKCHVLKGEESVE